MAIEVLSSLALKGVLEKFQASFEQSLGERLNMRFDATQAILPQIAAGARADLVILTIEAIEELRMTEARRLGSSGVGLAVRAGAPRPEIGTVDALRRALESAQSVAHSKVGASGIYFAELIERLPLKLKKRVIVEKGPVGLVVARGEAEIGVQQLCELAPVAGIDIVGPLPAPVQKLTHFAAGIPAHAANPKGAAALIALLASDAARAGMLAGAIQPATAAGP
jgi:molybdate transport system substrate-binding protein